MDQLESLYTSPGACNSTDKCDGCSILQKNKPVHAYLDHADIERADVLFLSDSLGYAYGSCTAFSEKEMEEVFSPAVKFIPKDGYTFSSAVKCPNVKEADMSPTNMGICRQYLSDTIDKVKPTLVFPCGNLAMKMLIKKSGITGKRGKAYTYTSDGGVDCAVVPIYHPYSVIKEPSHRILFEMDIKNAYEKYVEKKRRTIDYDFTMINSFKDLDKYSYMVTTSHPIAADIETTGLNFLSDNILTIAVSCENTTIVIPVNHKDSPMDIGDTMACLKWVQALFSNTNNKKVFHNAKFDLKFLLSVGISVYNVWDTRVMHHLINENAPNRLMDLVKMYFPTELDTL